MPGRVSFYEDQDGWPPHAASAPRVVEHLAEEDPKRLRPRPPVPGATEFKVFRRQVAQQLSFIVQPVERRMHGVDIAFRQDELFLQRTKGLRNDANVGADHRDATSHRLQYRIGRAFDHRATNEHVDLAVIVGHAMMRHERDFAISE